MGEFEKWQNYKNQEHASEVGNELGQELSEMGEELFNQFPRLSIFLGIVTSIATFWFGLNHWEIKPVLLVVLSIAAGGIGAYFGLVAIAICLFITLVVLLLNFLL